MLLLPLFRRLTLPEPSLYPLRVLAGAGMIFGASALAHGSGFIAVFVAGILLGDQAMPRKGETERFTVGLASLAEITAFIALGLSIDLDLLRDGECLARRDGGVPPADARDPAARDRAPAPARAASPR